MLIIRNPTYRLATFRNEMFDLEPTLPFLRSQPDLTVWQQCQCTPCELSDDLLTCLADASVDSRILQQLTSRLLTRITTKIERQNTVGERQFGDMLGAFGQSLVQLELEREVGEESLSMAEFITILAANLPLLNRLTLRNQGERVWRFPQPFPCLTRYRLEHRIHITGACDSAIGFPPACHGLSRTPLLHQSQFLLYGHHFLGW